jgi:hypothetical protein
MFVIESGRKRPKNKKLPTFSMVELCFDPGCSELDLTSNGFEVRLILITKAKLGYNGHVENERYNVKILDPNNYFSIQI